MLSYVALFYRSPSRKRFLCQWLKLLQETINPDVSPQSVYNPWPINGAWHTFHFHSYKYWSPIFFLLSHRQRVNNSGFVNNRVKSNASCSLKNGQIIKLLWRAQELRVEICFHLLHVKEGAAFFFCCNIVGLTVESLDPNKSFCSSTALGPTLPTMHPAHSSVRDLSVLC